MHYYILFVIGQSNEYVILLLFLKDKFNNSGTNICNNPYIFGPLRGLDFQCIIIFFQCKGIASFYVRI